MVKPGFIHTLVRIAAILLALAACSNPANTPPPSSAPPSPSIHATALATASTPTNVPAASPAATASKDTASKSAPTISIPPELHLSGHLILAGFNLGITRFDFATEQSAPIFQPVENSFVGAAVLSPNGQTYLMIYSPPRDPKDPLYGDSGPYTLPADGSGDPLPVLKDDPGADYYFSPAWSPDSHSIYYGRHHNALPGTPEKKSVGYFLTRYTLPDGPAQDLLRDVLSIDLSRDGQTMFYISGNLYSGVNNLYRAKADGTSPDSLLPGGASWIIDSMAVSPDEQTIVFSSSDDAPVQASLSWLDRLMGVEVAQAHNVPSDLFIMKIGERPRPLTHLADVGFIEAWSPDGQWIVFSCAKGVYVIRPDGSDQTMIMGDPVYGTIQWLS